MDISQRLKEVRRLRGFTQKSFAAALGIKHGTYRNWEQGINTPDNDALIKIVALLETTSDYLLGRTCLLERSSTSTRVSSEMLVSHLPPECAELESLCSGLTPEGLQKIVEYARDIADNPRYKKEGSDYEDVENRTA